MFYRMYARIAEGDLKKDPRGLKEKLGKYPPKTEKYFKPIDPVKFELLLMKNKNINPHQR